MPAPLREALDRFVAASRDDPRVVAAFLGGSFATAKADRHSDLDIYVLVADDAWDSFFADRRRFLGRLGDPILAEDFNQFGFDMLLFQLAAGAPGELALARASNFRHIHGGAYIPLVDKGAILDGVEFPMFTPEPPNVVLAGRENFVFFWRNLSKLPAALARRKLIAAFTCIDLSRRRALNLYELIAFPGEAPSGYERAEGLDPATLGELLIGLRPTFTRLEPAALLDGGLALAGFLHERGPSIAEKLGVEYPTRYAEHVIAALAEADDEAGNAEL